MSGIKIIKGVKCDCDSGTYIEFDTYGHGEHSELDFRTFGTCMSCNKSHEFDGSRDLFAVDDNKSEVKSDINETLDGREATYGKFSGQAAKCQALKDVMHNCEEWDDLSPSMKEALEMIVHKAARILNGKGCNYKDSWHDIAGYATLIEREIEENE